MTIKYSMRTKADLAMAKAKGVKRGGLRGEINARNTAKLEQTDVFAAKMWVAIGQCSNQGLITAKLLND